jgi:hypothetical protein
MYKLNFYLLLLCLFAVNTVTNAQEKRYQIGNCMNVLSSFRRQLAAVKPNGSNRLQLQLSSTRSLQAIINYRTSDGTASEKLLGSIANMPNSSFYLVIENNSVHGHILLRDSKKAYTYSSDNNGAVFVQETDINKIICIDYQKAFEPVSPPAAARVTTVMDAAALYTCKAIRREMVVCCSTSTDNMFPARSGRSTITATLLTQLRLIYQTMQSYTLP